MELFLMKRGAKPASELKATAGVKSASAATARTNSIGMEFVQIPAGSFMMGSGNGESDEKPSHHVTISKLFYLGKYEVTQEQWMAVMGSNPSKFKNGQKPVEMVNWNDAQEFIKRLNKKEGHNRYRLPSEAEWEYAARAGTTTDYSIGAGLLENYAVYESADSRSGPKLVGQKKANPWGLYDMHGNIGEWVQDLYGKDYYASSSDNDPRGPASGSNRVIRGGNWYLYAKNSRSAARLGETPVLKNEFIGFRLALDPE
jgi:formylglycine-generating enzyme required for sulfatase activity